MTDSDDRSRVEGRQAPEYGEYAPEGWVSPVVVPVAEEPEAKDPARATTTSPLSRPPAPGPTSGYDAPPPTGPPLPGAPPRPVRRAAFNRFATLILLAYGLYSVVNSALSTSQIGRSLVDQLESLGYLRGAFQSFAALQTVATVTAVIALPVFLLAAIWSIRRLRRGKNSWLVLLVTGLGFNILAGLALVVVMMNDPSYGPPVG